VIWCCLSIVVGIKGDRKGAHEGQNVTLLMT